MPVILPSSATSDPKAAYILGHIPDLVRAGIAGALFGPGNGGTEVYDRRHDSITNHPPISTYGCDRCNTQVSVYPDDGGYLRIFVGAYYKNGTYSLSGTGTPPGTPPVTRAGARSTAGTTPPPV